jgi:dimethylamine monooxygenase subunit A
MQPLPPQTVHLPFDDGPYRMSMDLVTAPEAAWFEIDALYPDELALKRHLLAQRHVDVFAAMPESDLARREALTLITDNLLLHHPSWFSRSGGTLRNHLTAEDWDIDAPPSDPLEVAARLVQEDLCLIQDIANGPTLSAAALCFPSRWRLSEKIGKRLPDVHQPVPFYAERLARPVDRFMRHVKPGHIASRLNWSLLDDSTLFQPGGKWRRDGSEDITVSNAGDRVFLRVERQTLRRLPISNAVLFGIRVHVYPLSRIAAQSGVLAAAIRALPEETMHYKSMLPFRPAVLAWLDRREI